VSSCMSAQMGEAPLVALALVWRVIDTYLVCGSLSTYDTRGKRAPVLTVLQTRGKAQKNLRYRTAVSSSSVCPRLFLGFR
jgi:hypothetical protein